MILTLYKTNDGANVINKTLTDPLQLNIVLKGNTDIVNPVLLLKGNFKGYNYAFIDGVNRYYNVVDITAYNNSVDQLTLECDVLETYKADILNSNARFMRNIKTGDYIQSDLDSSVFTKVTKSLSNRGFTGLPNMILTTVGV